MRLGYGNIIKVVNQFEGGHLTLYKMWALYADARLKISAMFRPYREKRNAS